MSRRSKLDAQRLRQGYKAPDPAQSSSFSCIRFRVSGPRVGKEGYDIKWSEGCCWPPACSLGLTTSIPEAEYRDEASSTAAMFPRLLQLLPLLPPELDATRTFTFQSPWPLRTPALRRSLARAARTRARRCPRPPSASKPRLGRLRSL